MDVSRGRTGGFRYVVWLLSEPVAILTWGQRATVADAMRAAEEATRHHQHPRPHPGG